MNRNPQEGYDNRRGEVFADAALLRNLEDLNHEDMELYEAGLRVRDLRR